jgi:hypothetical protein
MNKSEIFKKAHQIAKATAVTVGNYMVAFKLALIEVYQTMKKAAELTIEQKLIQAGCSVWENYGHRRIYMNPEAIEAVFGFRVTHYKTGNISGVNRDVNGTTEHYSNTKGGKIYVNLCDGFYDLNKECWGFIGSKPNSEAEEYFNSFLVI